MKSKYTGSTFFNKFASVFTKEPVAEEDRPYSGDVLGRLVYCLRPIQAQLPCFGGSYYGRNLQEITRTTLVQEAQAMAAERVIRKPEDLEVRCRIEPEFIWVEAEDLFTGGHATRSWMRDKKK